MIRSYFLLALVGTSVVAGNASEADKCASGDASCKGPVHGGGLDDQEVLLQSVMVHDKQAYAAHEDSAEDAAHEDSAEDGLSIAEKAMLEEEEKAALAEDDEEGKESLQSEANSKCKPCDTACLTKDNQESFVECDSDKNSKLTVQEVQACFHTTGAVLTELVSVTDAEAVQFVEQLDEDGDKELTQAEFSKSIQQCEASLVEEEQKETVISVTTIDCVDTKKVWKNFRQNVHNGCTKKQSKQSCSLLEEEEGTSGRRRRRRWGGGGRRRWVQAAVRAVQHVVRCVTNWVTVAFDCVKTVAKQVTKTVGQTFKDCWNKIKSQALGSLKDKAPFNSCSSANDCLKKLTTISIDVAGALQKKVGGVASQAGDVFKNILEDTGKKLVGVVDGMKAGGDSGLAQAQKTAKTLFDGLSGIASALAGAAVELAEAFIDFGQAAAKGIKANSNIGNRCTKSGYGFIYFAPTDCGAFSELASMSTNRLDLWPRKVANALAKFGQCFTKRAILGLPTPFLDRKMATMCVPQGVWTIIGGIVGTFRWAISQIKAGAAGCQNDEAPVCQLMNALTDMGNKLASKLGASFMQKSSELIGEKLHGDASRYAVTSEDNKDGFAVKCVKGTGDFQMFFAASMAWKIIPFMDMYKAGIKITWGCGSGVYFTHVMFSLAMSLFLVGYFNDPNAYFLDENKFGFTIDVGFNVGTAGSKDIIQWMGGLSLSGAVGSGIAGSKAGGGIAIAIKLLPNPDYPRGFATGPKLETTKSAALEEQWDEELEKAESPEESVHTNSKIMFKQIENTDVDEEKLLAAVEHGADSMMGRLQPGIICLWPFGLPNVCLQNIVLNAAVGVDFCITCGIMHGGSNGIISGPGDNQATSGTSYSLGPRRRRTRRRRDRRRRRTRRRRDRRRAGGASYKTSGYGSTSCPSGYSRIFDEGTCKKAMTAMRKRWGGARSWGNIQGGCFSHRNNHVWYNKNRNGRTHGHFSTVCSKAKTGFPSTLIGGDRFIQIGEWRFGEVDCWHASISHKNGKTAQIYRGDGTLHPGPRNDWHTWGRPLGTISGVTVGDRFIQIGCWRVGEVDGNHASMSHKQGKTAQIWRGDGTRHPGPRNDWHTWGRSLASPSGVSSGPNFLQMGKWRLGAVNGAHASMAHSGGKTAQIWRSDGTLHPGPRSDWTTWGRAGAVAISGASSGGGGGALPIGKCVALHNKAHNRFMRMNKHRDMDWSGHRSKNQLPGGWQWEKFRVVNAGNGQIGLHCRAHNRFVRMNRHRDMDASGGRAKNQLPRNWSWERFTVVNAGNGQVGLHNKAHNRFIRMQNRANMDASGAKGVNQLPRNWQWERFSPVMASGSGC